MKRLHRIDKSGIRSLIWLKSATNNFKAFKAIISVYKTFKIKLV